MARISGISVATVWYLQRHKWHDLLQAFQWHASDIPVAFQATAFLLFWFKRPTSDHSRASDLFGQRMACLAGFELGGMEMDLGDLCQDRDWALNCFTQCEEVQMAAMSKDRQLAMSQVSVMQTFFIYFFE